MAVQLNKFKFFMTVEKSLEVGKRKTKPVIIEGKIALIFVASCLRKKRMERKLNLYILYFFF